MRKIACLSALALVLGALAGPAGARSPAPQHGDAPYSVPLEVLDDAVDCDMRLANKELQTQVDGPPDRLHRRGRSEPILLVHGTGVNRRLNWEWNYWPALKNAGFAVCWVALPNAALSDIQIAAEYAARAVETINRQTGEEVDVLGHSQGGLVPRWAIKWFASGAAVDDYVGLASPNHGTVVADAAALSCMEACWQMKTTSRFISALNAGDETPGGIDYTSIYTASDELVQPVGTQELDGGTNILLQDVCPGRPIDHAGIAGDELTYRLVLDAVTKDGTADVGRLPDGICTTGQMDDVTFPPPDAFPPDWGDGHFSQEEPPLMPYVRTG